MRSRVNADFRAAESTELFTRSQCQCALDSEGDSEMALDLKECAVDDCDRLFIVEDTHGGYPQKYCSKACRQRAYEQRHSLRRAQTQTMTRSRAAIRRVREKGA